MGIESLMFIAPHRGHFISREMKTPLASNLLHLLQRTFKNMRTYLTSDRLPAVVRTAREP